jgi:FtsP/CotA-like multicopper oxidase with cupredoxin domain
MRRAGMGAALVVMTLALGTAPLVATPKDDSRGGRRVTHAERAAAAARAAAQGLALPAIGTAQMAMPGEAPHYFSVPNYANSPLRNVGASPGPVGNPLTTRQYPTDSATSVLVVNGSPLLAAGQLTEFRTLNMPGSGPNEFRAYVLRPTGVPDTYAVVFDSGPLAVAAVAAEQLETFPVGPVAVLPGDVIAHYGNGIPLDIGTGTDTLLYPAPTAPAADQMVVVGAPEYPVYPQARAYSIAATVQTDSGGIRKFVDALPGLGPTGANGLGQYIPVAVPDTTTYPGSDYYEIAVVQFTEQMHSDLPPTTLRGYVQLSTGVVPGEAVALTRGDGSPILLPGGAPALAVDSPHYLGPLISATKNRPVRILFRNLLPAGVEGNLFIPVDTTVMGSGMGPMMEGMSEPTPRTPMCGMLAKDPGCFTENRATLHLHGGISPWISDGTPHQWITPADETTPYPKGVSVQNVPDMVDPGPGAQTFFYTNQQSARLMFYHDHSWGITRLNVYAGEAAPYVITDPAEEQLRAQGILPADEIPLVIQDKTFVPDEAQLAATDPLWDLARWGGTGDLWIPHVYVPAQNPGDASGVNQFGRWAYGPWFWPPTSNIDYPPIDNAWYDPTCNPDLGWCEPPLMPGTPFLSMGMESFHDTPVVNGTAYPTLTVEPKTYRLRILNAANDRFWNLQLYEADATGTEVALDAAEVAAALTDPTVFPTPDTIASPPGPSWIQIGTEGGFLPAPVVIPPQPITWVNDPTVFNAGNVDQHSLLLGPAERADVIVDFSAFAGKTLILYNDAPAAFPARDARYDYYTGNPDLRETGGAPSTPAGYGPNTRTIMQIKVASAAPAPAYVLELLEAAFAHHADGTGVFESSQNPIIVGQAEYNSAYGTAFQANGPRAGLVQIFDEYLAFDTLAGVPLTLPLQRKAIQDEMGEAFEKEYGRMSGNLGLETPNAQAGLQQNLILYPYVNPASEILDGIELPPGVDVTPIASADDGSQIWKITHNGVDTHPIHFHLFDVQTLNRVGWDGIIRRPEPNELGWKDTLRISPLEDTIVALRPIVPKIPFGLVDSVRPLNPMMPLGTTEMFNSTDANGDPIVPPITNEIVNFGWEYVWHCHILSHEEMDMMRPISVDVARTLPAPPIISTFTQDLVTGLVTLGWVDGTPADLADLATWGDPGNEIGFRIERADVASNGKVGAYAQIGTALANQTAYTDVTAAPAASYSYRVLAFNAAGVSTSSPVGGAAATSPPTAPTNVIAALQAGPRIGLTFRDGARNEDYFLVERSVDGAPFALVATPPTNGGTGTVSFVDDGVAAGHAYVYRVAAVNGAGSSAWATSQPVAVPAAPAAPSNLAASAVRSGKKANVTLSWTDNASAPASETGFELQRATNASFTVGLVSSTVAENAVTVTQTGLYRGVTYYFRIRALGLGGPSGWSNVASVVTP